jgi:hypothetical protein
MGIKSIAHHPVGRLPKYTPGIIEFVGHAISRSRQSTKQIGSALINANINQSPKIAYTVGANTKYACSGNESLSIVHHRAAVKPRRNKTELPRENGKQLRGI